MSDEKELNVEAQDIPATSCALVIHENMEMDLVFAKQDDMDGPAPDNALLVASIAHLVQHNRGAVLTAMAEVVKLGEAYEEEQEANPS